MGVDKAQTKQKICLVTISLARGGAERSVADLSEMLTAKGYQVFIASVTSAVDFAFAGQLFTIGKGRKTFGIFTTIGQLLRFRDFLEREQFDLIIDNRSRSKTIKESIYSGFLYKGFKALYVVHSFKLTTYFPPSRKMAQKMIRRSVGHVGVSKAIVEHIKTTYNTQQVYQLYNPLPIAAIQKQAEVNEHSGKYILAMGRMVDAVKNYSLLLEAYSQSTLPENGILLYLIGDGQDKEDLQFKADTLKLTKLVRFLPFDPNPFPYLKNALCTILTSHYEGFPRTLAESLAAGTPVISVDCQSGPAEIIQNEHNGLLVANYDGAALAEALNNLIFNPELYARCKANAKASVAHLDIARIADAWDELIQKLL